MWLAADRVDIRRAAETLDGESGHALCPGDGMTPPSTPSQDTAGTPRPAAEPAANRPSSTHSNVQGEPVPRMPHERDESSDSGVGEPNEVMKRAADDLEEGRTDKPRGPQTQEEYSELTGQAQRDAKPS